MSGKRSRYVVASRVAVVWPVDADARSWMRLMRKEARFWRRYGVPIVNRLRCDVVAADAFRSAIALRGLVLPPELAERTVSP